MFAVLDQRNTQILAARASDSPTTRAAVRGKRTLCRTTYQRIRGVLRAALNDAIAEGLIATNPARHLEIPSDRPRPREWTPNASQPGAPPGISPARS